MKLPTKEEIEAYEAYKRRVKLKLLHVLYDKKLKIKSNGKRKNLPGAY